MTARIQTAPPGLDTTFSSTVTATFGSPNTAGNAILLAWEGDTGAAGSANTPTDTAGNTYTRLLTKSLADVFDLEVWVAHGIAAKTGNAVTVTDTIGGSDGILIIEEWSGLASALDAVSSATGAGTTLAAGAFTLTRGADLVWAAGVQNQSANDLTAGAGFTSLTQAHTSFSNLGICSQFAGAGTFNGGFTSSASSPTWSAGAVALASTGFPVGTAPSLAASVRPGPHGRPASQVTIQNGPVPIYAGGPGVTSSNGAQIAAGASWPAILFPGDQLWVTAGTVTTISVLQT